MYVLLVVNGWFIMAIDRTQLKKRMFNLGASNLPTLNNEQSKDIEMKFDCDCGGEHCPQTPMEYHFESRYSMYVSLTDDFLNDIGIDLQDKFNPYTYYGNEIEPLIANEINRKFGVNGKEKNGVKYKNYIFKDNFAISHDWYSEEPLFIEANESTYKIHSAEIKTTTNKGKDIDVSKYYYQTQAQLHFEKNEAELLVCYERPNVTHWSKEQIDILISQFDPNEITYYLVLYDQEHFNEFVQKRMNPFIQCLIEAKNGVEYSKKDFDNKFQKLVSKRKIKKCYIKLDLKEDNEK